jgi:anti-anti-sigma factor
MRTAAATVQVDEQGDGSVAISVAGELDANTRLLLARALGRHERRHVVLDLAAVTFADSAGLNAIIAAHSAATREGGTLEIVAVSSNVRRLLRLTNAGGALLKRIAS